MDPVDRHSDVVHWRAQETDLGQSSRHGKLAKHKRKGRQVVQQTRCISERRTEWDPPGRHKRRDALTSTRNRFGAPLNRSSALVSTNQIGSTDRHQDIVHWQAQNKLGPILQT